MKYLKLLILLICISQITTSCNSGAANKPAETNVQGKNHMSMKINGKLWEANNDVSGAFHPKGYDQLIMMAGSFGPKNKDEQTFNINLYNAAGPGVYHLTPETKDDSAVQLGNYTPENYLYGNVLGFDVTVRVIKSSSDPTVIEATFEGTLNGNASDVIKITEGKFYYHE